MSKFLDIHELRKEKERKQEKRIAIFNEILKLCHSKIIRASKDEKDKCIYQVPEMKIGLPVYNLNSCIAYLILNLNKNGFKVRFIKPNYLFIDWSKENSIVEKKTIKAYQTEENPLLLEDFIPINTSKDNKNDDYFRNLSSINNSNIYDDDLINNFQNMTSKLNKNDF